MCDIIWCKKCGTVNYLDPYYFWNWQGKTHCAECKTVYYIHMINGFMYAGPEERPDEQADILPLYADKPMDGFASYLPGTEGRTRPFQCQHRHIYLGKPDMVKFSIRGKPLRGWRPQPPSTGRLGSYGFKWDVEKLSPEVWAEYQEKRKRGEVREW